jgi:hypothetical protein
MLVPALRYCYQEGRQESASIRIVNSLCLQATGINGACIPITRHCDLEAATGLILILGKEGLSPKSSFIEAFYFGPREYCTIPIDKRILMNNRISYIYPTMHRET